MRKPLTYCFLTFFLTIGLAFLFSFHDRMIQSQTSEEVLPNEFAQLSIYQHSQQPAIAQQVRQAWDDFKALQTDLTGLVFLPANATEAIVIGPAIDEAKLQDRTGRQTIVYQAELTSFYGRYFLLADRPDNAGWTDYVTKLKATDRFEIDYRLTEGSVDWRRLFQGDNYLFYLGTALELVVFVFILASPIWGYANYAKVHYLSGGSSRSISRQFGWEVLRKAAPTVVLAGVSYYLITLKTPLFTSWQPILWATLLGLIISFISPVLALQKKLYLIRHGGMQRVTYLSS